MMPSNPYELLYMIRTDDRSAHDLMYRENIGLIYSITGDILESYPVLKPYLEDIVQEAVTMIPVAEDRYREDREAGFPTFFNVLLRRKIMNVVRSLMLKKMMLISETVQLGIRQDESYEPVFISSCRSRMMEPEYYTGYQLAKERYEKAVQALPEEDRKLIHAYQVCDSVKDAAKKLNMPLRRYYNRTARIRRKLTDAVHG